MKTDIYYFSGTGNSLAIAKQLGNMMDDSSITSIPDIMNKTNQIKGEVIGIVCPIYMYNMPHIVAKFIKRITSVNYLFIVFAGGGELGLGLKKTKKIFRDQNIKLSSLFNIPMPDNSFLYENTEMKLKMQFDNADKLVKEIVRIVDRKEEHFDGSNTSLFKTYIHPGIYSNMGYSMIPKLDKDFMTNEKCDGCSICQKVCPANNITMKSNKPVWKHQCEMCYACINWCPKASIECGKKSLGKTRYQNPTVEIKDMMSSS